MVLNCFDDKVYLLTTQIVLHSTHWKKEKANCIYSNKIETQ